MDGKLLEISLYNLKKALDQLELCEKNGEPLLRGYRQELRSLHEKLTNYSYASGNVNEGFIRGNPDTIIRSIISDVKSGIPVNRYYGELRSWIHNETRNKRFPDLASIAIGILDVLEVFEDKVDKRFEDIFRALDNWAPTDEEKAILYRLIRSSKQCQGPCERVLPVSSFIRHADGSREDLCTECYLDGITGPPLLPKSKICKGCGDEKHRSLFKSIHDRKHKDGLSKYCAECLSKKSPLDRRRPAGKKR